MSSTSESTSYIKLDKVEQLTGASNYGRWRTSMKRILALEKLLKITETKQEIPDSTCDADKETLDIKNQKVLVILQMTIAPELQYLIAHAQTAYEGWNALSDAFDRHNTMTSIYQFKASHQLTMHETETLFEYIHRFDIAWSDALIKFSNSTDELGKKLLKFYQEDMIKTACLLVSLPEQYNNTVDNIQTKDKYTFDDVKATLLALKSSNATSAKALTATHRNSKYRSGSAGSSARNSSSKPPGKSKTAPSGKNECSWCKSRRLPFSGNIFLKCAALKAHQEAVKKDKERDSGKAKVAQEVTPEQAAGRGVAFIADTGADMDTEQAVGHGVVLIASSGRITPFNGVAYKANGVDIYQ